MKKLGIETDPTPPNKITHEEYLDRLDDVHDGKIEPLEDYVNINTPIRHLCSCGYEWLVEPSSLVNQETGCPNCSGKKQKTTEEYWNEVENLTNGEIEVRDEYINAKTKIGHHCNICGTDWKTTPDRILQGNGCPECGIKKCANSHRFSQEEFESRVDEAHDGTIKPLGKYVSMNKKMKFECQNCGNIWFALPTHIVRGVGCPECVDRWEGRRRTTEEYKEEVRDIHGEDIKVLGEYDNYKSKIRHKCNKCGYVFEAVPDSVLHGHGCQYCRKSKGEEIIEECMKNLDLDYDREVKFDGCKGKRKLPFDFAIYSNDDLIGLVEHDGKPHYQPVDYFGGKEAFKQRIKHDHIKDQYALSHSIPLLRLNYMDRDNGRIENKLKKFLADII